MLQHWLNLPFMETDFSYGKFFDFNACHGDGRTLIRKNVVLVTYLKFGHVGRLLLRIYALLDTHETLLYLFVVSSVRNEWRSILHCSNTPSTGT